MAYNKLEPFGLERMDMGFGIVASTMANIHRDAKKKKKPFSPGDFMPDYEQRTPKVRPWQEQLKVIEMYNVAFGGKDLRQ